MDSETSREFPLGEQPAGAQSIEARAKAVGVHDILHTLRRESRPAFAGPRGPAGTEPTRVEDVGDLVVDVIIEQLVDELDDLRRRLHHLTGCFRVHGR